MVYAVSVLAVKGMKLVHSAILVEASNGDEAVGKGYRAAVKAYPPEEGWNNHHVTATRSDKVLDVEAPFTVT